MVPGAMRLMWCVVIYVVINFKAQEVRGFAFIEFQIHLLVL